MLLSTINSHVYNNLIVLFEIIYRIYKILQILNNFLKYYLNLNLDESDLFAINNFVVKIVFSKFYEIFFGKFLGFL